MVIAALSGVGLPCLVPFGGSCPFDIAALLPDDRLIRIQVKCGRVRDECIQFNTCTTDHGRGRQSYKGKADYIAVYVDSIDRVFFVSVDDCPNYIGHLRLAPPRNNQRIGVRLAEDYSFERWAASLEYPLAA